MPPTEETAAAPAPLYGWRGMTAEVAIAWCKANNVQPRPYYAYWIDNRAHEGGVVYACAIGIALGMNELLDRFLHTHDQGRDDAQTILAKCAGFPRNFTDAAEEAFESRLTAADLALAEDEEVRAGVAFGSGLRAYWDTTFRDPRDG